MAKAPEKPKKYEDRLMAALAFDETDLETNQAGQISWHQLNRLNSVRVSEVSTWTIGLMFGIFLLILVSAGIGSVAFLSPATAAVPLGIVAFIIALSVYFSRRIQRINADRRERQVAQVEGRIDLAAGSGQNAVDYFVRVGDMRFRLKQREFLAFKNGDPYRIYYAPHSKRILSVEWLRENDDNLLDEGESRADMDSLPESETIESRQQRRLQ